MNWQKITATIKQHVWGPIGSAIFHVILILVLVNMAMQGGEQQTFNTQEVTMDVTESKTPPPEDKKIEDQIKPPDKQQDLNTMPTDVPTIGQADDSAMASDAAGNDRGPADLGFGGKEGTTANGLDMASTIKSPLILKGIAKGYGGRFGKGGLGRGGGRSKQIDDAILKALRWLKANQRGDGGWAYGGNLQGSGGNDVAVSGLALLCFLAYGKTTSDAEFGPTVEKAINFVKSKQNAEGYFAAIKAENCPQAYPYTHGIATYAMCEAYGMTRIPDLQGVMDKAVQIIIAGQQKETGGWDYQYAKGARRDTSVSAWQVQSLKASLIAGCTVPGIKEALEASVKDMKKLCDSKTGHFGYEKAGDRGAQLGMTGAATLCLQFTGHGKDVEAMNGLRAMREAKLSWDTGGGEQWPLYAYYYVTQCRFQESKESFAAWQGQFVPAYLKAQDPDGHWPAMGGGKGEGSHGPVYSTTFGCLTLETFVRFLPSYQHIEEAAPSTAPADDVVVKVL